MNKKNNKKDNDKAPSLDLSFAYGTSVMKRLTEQDIRDMSSQESDAGESTGDTTIRAITSLYSGKRNIFGMDESDADED